MVEWGGHHGGWGGFGPPSYIVKKCPGIRTLNDLINVVLINRLVATLVPSGLLINS